MKKETAHRACRLLRADQESGSSPVNSLSPKYLKKSKVRIHQSIGQYYCKTTYSIRRLLRANQPEGSVPLNPFQNNDLCLDQTVHFGEVPFVIASIPGSMVRAREKRKYSCCRATREDQESGSPPVN